MSMLKEIVFQKLFTYSLERDIDRFRIDDPCKGSHGNNVLVLNDKTDRTIGFVLWKERPHGEWIVQRLQNGFDDVYCPFCKARPT